MTGDEFFGPVDPQFLLRLCCSHENSTPADGTGRAICTKCGSVFQKHVSISLLQRTADQILYGVSYEDAWGNRIDPKDVHAGIPDRHPGSPPGNLT